MTDKKQGGAVVSSLSDTRGQKTAWLQLSASRHDELAAAQAKLGLDLSVKRGRAAAEEAGFILIPVEMVIRQGQQYRETSLLFALSKDRLISVEQDVRVDTLEQVSQQLNARAEAGQAAPSPASILFMILQALNDQARATISDIAERLDERSDTVAAASGGFDTSGRQAGVADIASTAIGLGEAEELVAKTVEGQLMLARAGRWLRRTPGGESPENLSMLLSDIQSLRRYARFQHDKIRNLQQSLMTTLDLKQNQVIKVFTVVTAVFLPPTLIAAFYGQNFANMPELEIIGGEWLVMGMTAVFALAPLAYVKRKGWMR